MWPGASLDIGLWTQVAIPDSQWTQIPVGRKYLKLAGVPWLALQNARGQCLTESQLRRCLQRLEQLKFAQNQDPFHIPLRLINCCLTSFRFFGWRDILDPHQWHEGRRRARLSPMIYSGNAKMTLSQLGEKRSKPTREPVSGLRRAHLPLDVDLS